MSGSNYATRRLLAFARTPLVSLALFLTATTGQVQASGIRTEVATITGVAATLAGTTRSAPDAREVELRQQALQRKNAAHARRRSRDKHGSVMPALVTTTREISGAQLPRIPGDILARCSVKQNSGAPTSPPAISVANYYRTTEITVNFVGDHVRIQKHIDLTCEEEVLLTLSEYWALVRESQDIFLGATVRECVLFVGVSNGSGECEKFATPSARSTTPSGPVVFIASLANSKFNDDTALFVAVARANRAPRNLEWHQFRIQLTKVADNTRFCTPAATSIVLPTLRVGVSRAGRLFVAFDSVSEDFSTTTGSVLSFEIDSLLRGISTQVKCFTGTELEAVTPPNVRDDNLNAFFVAARSFSNVIKRFKLKVAGHARNDTMVATPDINVPAYGLPPAAVQPNGSNLYSGGSDFRLPSVQIGNALWNVHTIDDGHDHSKVRLYKFGANATAPQMLLTLSTVADKSDDLISPSFDIDSAGPDGKAFVTFTRTIASNVNKGNATLMMASGSNSSPTDWTSQVLMKSPGQISKNAFGLDCDPFAFAGCAYGPDSATLIDPVNNMVWGWGEIITNDTFGGPGSEKNWIVKGFGVAR